MASSLTVASYNTEICKPIRYKRLSVISQGTSKLSASYAFGVFAERTSFLSLGYLSAVLPKNVALLCYTATLRAFIYAPTC
jgi:hypothetical protein